MSAAFVDSARDWQYLLETWKGLEVPEGWRPELTVEGIHMTPPPGGPHNLIADLVDDALRSVKLAGCGVFQTLALSVEQVGAIYIPDLCVVPRDVIPRNADPVPADDALLAVEITSKGNARDDRTKKKWAYAHGPIPLYLLIDAFDENGPAVSLFSEPEGGVYGRSVRVPFGKPIDIGEPFNVSLDTSRF